MMRRNTVYGFTMIEMMIVIIVVGILVTLAEPTYQKAVIKAREVALRQDLFTLREVLDQYKADRGKYPPSLPDVIGLGYLRRIPVDPFTQSEQTWQVLLDPRDAGISDVHSGSPLVALDGTPYNLW